MPEYTNVVMAELAKPQTQESFKDSIRDVLADAVANTFGTTDMTTYNAILKHYGCPSWRGLRGDPWQKDRGSGHEG